jgi:hypothetical protein
MVATALSLLQRHLDGLYRTGLRHRVDQFIIGEHTRRDLERAGAIAARTDAREEIYVLEEAGGLSMAVFIDAAAQSAVERLGEDGTLCLDAEGFADFCVALEGVSHFLLLAHRAQAETPVTQLELELQAEVDKYLAARLLTWRADNGPMPEALRHRLFKGFSLERGLDHEQRERYRTANRFAMRYCDFLERTFLRERRLLSLLRELRSFFRAPQRARLSRIGA